MTLSRAILRDLLAGQTTASSAAGRLKIDHLEAEKLLNEHVRDLIASKHNYSGLVIYRITDKGREEITPKTPS